MRSQAQQILGDSQAQRAQAEAGLETRLASRREEADRREAERLAAARAATQKLVSDAEQRATPAGQRAARATAHAEQTLRARQTSTPSSSSPAPSRTPTRSSPRPRRMATSS